MKKQGDVYLKITAILLAVLICVYALVSVFGHDGQTYSLETAVYCEVGDGVSVSGFVVRSESAIVTDQIPAAGAEPLPCIPRPRCLPKALAASYVSSFLPPPELSPPESCGR